MSLLWVQGMAWYQMPDDEPKTPVSVRHAGYAGYVGPGDDEDLKTEVAPSITPSVFRYKKMHGEPPQAYQDEHRERYEKAKANQTAEDVPDIEDSRLHHFIRHTPKKIEFEPYSLDLSRPVYATQSHVAREHIQRYLDDPDSQHQGHNESEYPVVVTHEGRMHAGDGHHRIAAALARGDSHIPAWHFNLDRHYIPGYDDEDH